MYSFLLWLFTFIQELWVMYTCVEGTKLPLASCDKVVNQMWMFIKGFQKISLQQGKVKFLLHIIVLEQEFCKLALIRFLYDSCLEKFPWSCSFNRYWIENCESVNLLMSTCLFKIFPTCGMRLINLKFTNLYMINFSRNGRSIIVKLVPPKLL